MSAIKDAEKAVGDAIVEYLDCEIVYGLDDRCLKWHRRRMINELNEIVPWPCSRRDLLKLIKGA